MPIVYSELAPSAPLADFVKCFWILRGQSADAPPVERILPDGAFELVFHFGDPFTSNGEPQPAAMLVGQIRRPTLVTPSRRADVLGVRFHIGGAAAFFREPAAEFRDRFLPMTGCSAILDARTTRERVAAVERFLLRRLQPRDRWTLARDVAALIAERDGTLRSRELTRVTGRAERTIERAFEECVGMTPKTFSRLMRFHAFLGDPLQDHGYFDDAHLIHEFQAFAGVSPAQFRRETNALNDAFF
jgi:AraC-like DNA-binding protein